MFGGVFKNILHNIRIMSGVASFGSGSNKLDIDSDGYITLSGLAKRGSCICTCIDVVTQISQAKPTQVVYGVHKGFSMPIYNADNEELLIGGKIPTNWDGISDLKVFFIASLSGAEGVGDKFKFDLLWDVAECEGTILDTYVTVSKEITVLTSREGQYSNYCLTFDIDHDAAGHIVTSGGIFNMILRRVAASELEVTNEIIILNNSDGFSTQVNKLYEDF